MNKLTRTTWLYRRGKAKESISMLSWFNSSDCDSFAGCSGYTRYKNEYSARQHIKILYETTLPG